MKKYIPIIIFLLTLFCSSAFSQYKNQIVPIVEGRESAFHDSKGSYNVKFDGKDSLYTYNPGIWELKPEATDTKNEKPSITTRSYHHSDLSHIPTSHAVDKNKDLGEIQIIQGENTGALTYTIPFSIYQIENGIMPEVFFYYNSHSNNGIGGIGWQIGGISSISVANSTPYYDNTNAPVKLTKSCAFFLDGVRLIDLKSGTTSLINYETERNNIKVTAYLNGDHIKYFIAKYPDGRIATFGFDTTTITKISYPLTQIEDIKGNLINYNYSISDNTYYLSNIKYGGKKNTAIAPFASINFVYQSRTDATSFYIDGTEVKMEKRIKEVNAFFKNELLRKYQFKYNYSNGLSLLKQIDCSSNGKYLNPLIFYYGENNQIVEFEKSDVLLSSYFANSSVPDLYLSKGKFNYYSESDGLISYPRVSNWDIIVTKRNGKGQAIAYQYGSKYHPDQSLLIYNDLSYGISDPIKLTAEDGFLQLMPGDVDGDGSHEIVKINSSILNSSTERLTFKIYNIIHSSGQSFADLKYTFTADFGEVCSWEGLNSPSPKVYLTGDFLGNGKQNILAFSYNKNAKNDNVSSRATLIEIDNKKKSSTHDKTCFNLSFDDYIFALDFDGDGKTDICHINSVGTKIYSFNTSGQLVEIANNISIRTSTLSNRELLLGDLNSDGKTDFILSPQKSDATAYSTVWTTYYSTGKGFKSKTTNCAKYESKSKFVLQDMNGDNIPDLVVNSNGLLKIYLTKNGSISSVADSKTCSVNSDAHFITGSVEQNYKMSQLFTLYNEQLVPITFTRNDYKQQLLTGVINSYGIINKHSYEDTQKGNSYLVGSKCPFPYINLTGKFYLLNQVDTYNNNSLISSVGFYYQKGVFDLRGRGFLGFEKITAHDNLRNGDNVKIFDPYNLGILKSEESPLSTITYQTSVSIASNKITKIRVNNKTVKDKLKDTSVSTLYTYDTYGNVTKEVVNYSSKISSTTTNSYNNHTGTVYKLGELYDQVITNQRDGSSASKRTTISYDSKRQPTNRKEYYNGNLVSEESLVYDEFHNILEKKTKPYASTVWLSENFEYDLYNRITKKTDPLEFYQTYLYDSIGQLASIENHKNKKTTFKYDIWNNRIKEIKPDGSTEEVISDWASDLSNALFFVITASTGKPAKKIYYDALGREIRKGEIRYDGKYVYVDNVYDSKGRLQKTSLPFKEGTTVLWNNFSYDSYNRITQLTYASGKKDTYSYDKNKVTSVIDNISTTKTYDADGEVIYINDPAGTIGLVVRPDKKISQSTSPKNIHTLFQYDDYGRQSAIIDPSAGRKTFAYDSYGNINQETDANGKSIKYTYDAYGRMKEKRILGGQTITYDYNKENGLLEKETSTNGISKTYTYNDLFQLIAEKHSITGDGKWFEKTYVYSGNGIESTTYSSNNGIIVTENYTYAHGHLTEIKLNNSNSIWKLTSENNLGMTTGILTGVLAQTCTFDQYGFPTSRSAQKSSKYIQNFAYNFNPQTGNLNWRKDNTRSLQEDFNYDNLNRLTQFNNKVISYDNKGNITDNTEIGSYIYRRNRPFAIESINPNGNSIPLRNQSVSYDAMMRPVSITENGFTARYLYSGNGDRVKMHIKKNNADQLIRYYLGNQYEIESGVAGNKEKLYLGGSAYNATAVYVKEGSGAWTVNYICRDYLGSITHITNSSGTLRQELSYDPWGRLRNPVNQTIYTTDNQPIPLLGRGFTGHEHLNMFGLINMNARLYDAVTGRFLSADPYVQKPDFSQSHNRYSYCLNNPLKYVDPSGEFAWFIPVIIGAVIGAYTGASIQSGTAAFWNWSSDAWKGAIIGGIMGAGAGALGTGLIGTSGGITGLTSTSWAIASNALTASNIAMGSSALQGRNLDGIWKSGLIGLGAGAIGGWANMNKDAFSLLSITESAPQILQGSLYGLGDRLVLGHSMGYRGLKLVGTGLMGMMEGGLAGGLAGHFLEDNSYLINNLAMTSVSSVPGLTLDITRVAALYAIGAGIATFNTALISTIAEGIGNDLVTGLSMAGLGGASVVGYHHLIKSLDHVPSFYPQVLSVNDIYTSIINIFRN